MDCVGNCTALLEKAPQNGDMYSRFACSFGADFTLGMKNLIARERPFNNPLGLLNETMLLIPAPIDRYSFPSGHTLSSFAAAWCVFLRNRKAGAWCIVLAVLIAFSRLYLYVHYTTDIIFGAVFGILSAWAVNKIENKLSAYFGQRNRKK